MTNYWIIFGLVAISGSIVGYIIFPYALKFGLKSQTNLAKNGLVFPLWSKPPFLTDSSMYLYEVENPKQALKGEKIRLKRKGPYEFKVANNKERAEFSVDEEQVTLYATRKFFYQPEISADIDEEFWMLNPIVPGTHTMVKQILMDKLPFQQLAAPIVYQTVNVVLDLHNERLFDRRTPRDILYGYKVRLLENVFDIADRFGLGTLLPQGPPENIFGIAFFQNVTEDLFTLYTGLGDSVDRLGDVIKWRGKDRMSIWKGKQCNKIEGTNGEIQKPMPVPGQPIKVFLAQACRSLTLDPIGKADTSSGMETIEYEISRSIFQGVRTNPDNLCYCSEKKTPECQLDGFANMGPCLFNAPIYLSSNNFKGVDQKLKRLVELNENDSSTDLEKMSFYIEPLTGATLRADLNLMASIKVLRVPYMKDLENVRNISYVPFFLTRELIELPPSITWQLRALTLFANHYGYVYLLGALIGGMFTAYGINKKSKPKVIDVGSKRQNVVAQSDKPSTEDYNNKMTSHHDDNINDDSSVPSPTEEFDNSVDLRSSEVSSSIVDSLNKETPINNHENGINEATKSS